MSVLQNIQVFCPFLSVFYDIIVSNVMPRKNIFPELYPLAGSSVVLRPRVPLVPVVVAVAVEGGAGAAALGERRCRVTTIFRRPGSG